MFNAGEVEDVRRNIVRVRTPRGREENAYNREAAYVWQLESTA